MQEQHFNELISEFESVRKDCERNNALTRRGSDFVKVLRGYLISVSRNIEKEGQKEPDALNRQRDLISKMISELQGFREREKHSDEGAAYIERLDTMERAINALELPTKKATIENEALYPRVKMLMLNFREIYLFLEKISKSLSKTQLRLLEHIRKFYNDQVGWRLEILERLDQLRSDINSAVATLHKFPQPAAFDIIKQSDVKLYARVETFELKTLAPLRSRIHNFLRDVGENALPDWALKRLKETATMFDSYIRLFE